MDKVKEYSPLVLVIIVSILVSILCTITVYSADDKENIEFDPVGCNLPMLGVSEESPKKTYEVTGISYSEYSYADEIEAIDYETKYVSDGNMYKGDSKVKQEGIKGEKIVTYLVKYDVTDNGKEFNSKTEKKSVVTKEPTVKIVNVGTKEKPKKISSSSSSSTGSASVSLPKGGGTYSPSNFKLMGVLSWGGWRWTWYSEKVLPGKGLSIPGRHVDSNRFVCDRNDYICLASDSLSRGTVVDTPFGKKGKVYDCGVGRRDTLDVYVSW